MPRFLLNCKSFQDWYIHKGKIIFQKNCSKNSFLISFLIAQFSVLKMYIQLAPRILIFSLRVLYGLSIVSKTDFINLSHYFSSPSQGK